MHSTAGALGETRHVYEPAARLVWARGWEPTFLSVGLGLGYLELMLAALAPDEQWRCTSYESVPALREEFVAWARGERVRLHETYEAIAAGCGGEARAGLQRALVEGRWRVEGELTADTKLAPASGIFFDAFSRRSSPGLWSVEFLESFVARAAAPKCVFATYAATGDLKRVLRAAGFTVEARAGFAGKREHTFAVRS